MSHTVYIVSHRGPYAEKAISQKFYLDRDEASEVAADLSKKNSPGVYSVWEMALVLPEELVRHA